MFKFFLPLVGLLLLGLQPALGHVVWLQPKDGSLKVMFGHGEKCDPYKPKYVEEFKGLDCNGKAVPVEAIKTKDSVSFALKEKPAIVIALWDSGYGLITTDGWKKMTKREAKGKYKIVEALKNLRYCKALLAPCDNFSKPVGEPFEIVPEKNPFSLKPGDALSVQVLLKGKPVEGAEMSTYDSDPYLKDKPKTDKDGKASILIDRNGFHMIHAQFKTPLKNDPDADILRYSSSLSFTLK